MTPTVVNCDVTDRQAVDVLFDTASGLGTVASVIHTAGVSPSMGDADYVMKTNALDTLNVNEAFVGAAAEGSAIVNVASMAAHMLPEEMIPFGQFPLALHDEAAFMTGMLAACDIVPEELRSGIAPSRLYNTQKTPRKRVSQPLRPTSTPSTSSVQGLPNCSRE
ncbi:MAG: hypothetical protein QOC63_3659 [Mycobacterium sp.]|nr:hypothetical protein [Mycobacterium sp.]